MKGQVAWGAGESGDSLEPGEKGPSRGHKAGLSGDLGEGISQVK